MRCVQASMIRHLVIFILAVAMIPSIAAADPLFIASPGSHVVYRYDVGPTGIPTLDATITHSKIDRPWGLAISPTGELLVADQSTKGVHRYADPAGSPGYVSSISGSWNNPQGMAFRGGNELFVANANNLGQLAQAEKPGRCTIVVGALKHVAGSGGPARVFALCP